MDLQEIYKQIRKLAWEFGAKGFDKDCCKNLKMSEVITLEVINDKPNCSIKEINNSLGFTKSGATRVIERLLKFDLISKCISPEDKRVTCLQLTKEGKTLLEKVEAFYIDKLEVMLEPKSPLIRQKVDELMTLIETEETENGNIN